MTNIMPVLVMLGLPATAGTAEIMDAIRALQRDTQTQRKRAEVMEQAFNEDHARLQRAENPDNWRAVWTGEDDTSNIDTTPITHGNLISLGGTGQILFHFRPCCQNLRCKCTRRLIKGGYCDCHENDE